MCDFLTSLSRALSSRTYIVLYYFTKVNENIIYVYDVKKKKKKSFFVFLRILSYFYDVVVYYSIVIALNVKGFWGERKVNK